MSRNLNQTVHGPDPLTVEAVLEPDNGPAIEGVIDPVGTAHFAFTVPDEITGGAWRRFEADGWEPYAERVGRNADGTETGMPPGDFELPAVHLVLAADPTPDPMLWLPRLVAAGQHFRKATGERFAANQATDFHCTGRELNGEDITPVLTQRAGIGFNMQRRFTAYDIPNTIGVCKPKDHPAFYDDLTLSMKRANAFGFYVELVAFTGNQATGYGSLFANETAIINHWERLWDVAEACPNVILEMVNEYDVNANDNLPWAELRRPPVHILAAHGSGGSQSWPLTPHWGYATFHTNGAPEWQRKDSHNAWEIWKGPTLTNETTRYPDKTQRVDLAYDSGRACALLCAGRCFHSVHGKNSTLFTGIELDAALEVVRGAKSMPLSGQNLPYKHRRDLETAGLLRVYQRGTQPEHIAEIRK